MWRGLILAACALVTVWQAHAAEQRIVSLGGAITETIFALGAGDRVVGVDSSSTWPVEATKLPQVGYQRKISPEGVLSLKPTLIIASDEAGPPEAIEQLHKTGVKIVTVHCENSIAGAEQKVRAVAAALGTDEKADALATNVQAKAAEASKVASQNGRKPCVLFLYARSGVGLLAAGTGTEADSVITLAGGENVVTGYSGYRPLTAEAAVAAAPDVILSLKDGVESLGGEQKIYEAPGIALTPAGKNHRVVLIDSLLLLGFGPRTGDAILDLAKALHADAPKNR